MKATKLVPKIVVMGVLMAAGMAVARGPGLRPQPRSAGVKAAIGASGADHDQGNVILPNLLPASGASLVLYVDDDAPGDPGPGDPTVSDPAEDGSADHPFDAIQEGIDAAIHGDEVVVLDGTYTGDGNRDIDFGGRLITVRSENGPATCIIDCQASAADPHRGFYFHSDETTASVLDGFTIRNGHATETIGSYGYGGGIFCNESSPTIRNCIVTGCTAQGRGGGICCYRDSSPRIEDCTIIGNTASGGGGIYSRGSPTITDCVIVGNTATGSEDMGGGVALWWDSTATVSDCTISGNSSHGRGGGVSCWGHETTTFINCTISDNSAADHGGGAYVRYSFAFFINCVFSHNAAGLTSPTSYGSGGGLMLRQPAPPSTVTGCVFIENSASGSGGGAVFDVPYQGLNQLTVTDCAFIANSAGGGGGGARLGGHYGSSSASPWQQFVAAPHDCVSASARADESALSALSSLPPAVAVTDCTFIGNSAVGGGGLSNSWQSIAMLTRCTFAGNIITPPPPGLVSAGGAVSNGGNSILTLNDCTITGSTANLGGGIANIGWSEMTLINCRIVGCQASSPDPYYSGGGAVVNWNHSSLMMVNSVLSGNVSDYPGGGVFNAEDCNATLANCLLFGNASDSNGGGVSCRDGDATIDNCILWGDTHEEIHLDGGTAAVRYSNIQGGYAGDGNIDSDPFFLGGPSGAWTADGVYDPQTYQITFTDADAAWAPDTLVGNAINPDTAQALQFVIVANTATTLTVWANWQANDTGVCGVMTGMGYQVYDYRLRAGSRCVDAGDNTAVPLDVADLDGDGDTAERTPLDLRASPRFVDHPMAPDVGLPELPDYPEIVDMGPLEKQLDVCGWLDIRPGTCPNPLNRSSHGYLPVAVVGTGDFDVTLIVLFSVRLSRLDGIGGLVAPNEGPPGPHSVFEDVATPFGGDPCDCHDLIGDGLDDLSMKFSTQDVVAALELGSLTSGGDVELVITGTLLDGAQFTTVADCVTIIPPGNPGPDP